MSRYASAQQQSPQPTIEGDDRFISMNCKLDRDKLEPGYYPLAINKRVRRGVAETRPGTTTPVFANVEPFGTILGSGVYSNPNGLEVLMVATPTSVFQIHSGSYPTNLDLPAGVTLAAPVEFSQHFDQILLHQSNLTLTWNGVTPTGFSAITKRDPADTSTQLVPNVAWSFDLAGRSIFPVSPDEIGVSDILDYTSWDALLHKYRVNSGTSDHIVGVYPYAQGSVIIGKGRSFDILTGFTGTLANAAMEVLTTTRGLLARRSWKMVGGDGFFLGDDKQVYRLGQVVTDRLEASPVPVSDAIEPIMRRINSQYASGAVAAVHGEYYYLAVPLDDSTVNNVVLVYNTVSKGWEGYDTWNVLGGMRIDNLLVTDYFGSARLYAVNHGTLSVHLLYGGQDDQMAGGLVYDIADVLETRGYATLGWNAASRRDFQRAEIAVNTWAPSITATEITDSAYDERVLNPTPITRSRTRYQVFSRPDYDPTNANNDFEVAGREDYSADFTTEADLWNGISVETKQSSILRFATKARGRWVSYRIANTQGQCDIAGVLCGSRGSQREPRRAA